MKHISVATIGFCSIFIGTSASLADLINVPNDHALIQDAIDASKDGDVIHIEAGTYNEHLLNPGGKAITIQGTLNSNGSLATSINGGNAGSSVFVIQSEEDKGTVIKDLIITGGSANFGGGIYCVFADPTITGCTITNNTSIYGGGGIWCGDMSNPNISSCTVMKNTTGRDELLIYSNGGGINSSGGNPVITDCTISNNAANSSGGGISCYTNEHIIISDCTIEGNSAGTENVQGYGGGIRCSGKAGFDITASISGCKIQGNSATYKGGGINSIGLSSTIDDCLISNNTCENYGGGLHLQNSDSNIVDCIIMNNSSKDGGGITSYQSIPTITNCTISGNTASSSEFSCSGGGIFCYTQSHAVISNCMITNNQADQRGGGISCLYSDVTITNCTLSENSAYKGGGINCFSSDPDIISCQILDNTAGTGGGINCDSSSIAILDGSAVLNNMASYKGGGIHVDFDGGICLLVDSIVCGNDLDQIDGNWNDYGGNTIADECPDCLGDATGDLFIDTNDVIYILSAWGSNDVNADCDGNGVVNVDDILTALSRFGKSCY